MVLPHSNVVRLFFLQGFKEQIERRLVVIIFLLCAAVFDHIQNRLHVLILLRRFMQKIEHERGVQRGFGFLPERIVCFCAFRGGVLDEIVDQFEHIRVLADIAERIVAVRFCRIDQIEHTQHIAFLQKEIANGAEHFALWIGYNKAGVCKHEIRLCQKARLAAARTANYDLQEIPAVQLAVHAHLEMLRQDDILVRVLVAVLLVQFTDAAPGRRTVFLAGAGVLLSGVVEQNRAAVEQQK